MAGNFKDQGYRLLVNKAINQVKWVHPTEAKQAWYGAWTDCTDMDDEEFGAFLASAKVPA